MKSKRSVAVLAGLLGSMGLLGGCNDSQSAALFGAGFGALAGQAIGHDTESTLLGTAIGAGAGYIIGNESDKATRDHCRRGNYRY